MGRIFFLTLTTCVMSIAGLTQGGNKMFEKSQLYIGQKMRTFTGASLSEIAFPLGGIGTGTVSLGGRGDLRDWEIFNRPDKGGELNFTFFAIWAKPEGGEPVARILERKIMPPYRGGGHGVPQRQLSGVARLDEAVFRGEYPFASIEFKDANLPVHPKLQAWNPFIPLNVDDSSIPVAILCWTIENPSDKPVEVSIAATISNPIGDRYADVSGKKPGLGQNLNQYIDTGEFRGLFLSSNKVDKDDPAFGTMALVTTWLDLDLQTRWYRGGWWDQCHIFWDDFADDGRVENVKDEVPSDDRRSDVGALVLHASIPAKGSVTLPFFLTWHFPNRENYWNGEKEVRGKVMKNYVAVQFEDAWDVAKYTTTNFKRLESETRTFHDALFSSTLPGYVLDAVSSQASTIRTNVGMRLDDGSFFAFEGNSDHSGCCPMNCTHVWNYEQTLAYLFPKLERSMRETDFLHNTLPNGYMTFRTLIPLGDYWWHYKACADGQMGCIIRAFREWKLAGDNEWLRKMWPKVKLALEFAWKGCGAPPPKGFEWTGEKVIMPWDPDKNGVMEGEQHNTYDIEFYGPNTMMGSLYLGALKAATEMAQAMGEPDKVDEYQNLYERGRKLYDKQLWGGDYYVQNMYVLEGLEVPERLVSPESECQNPLCEGKKTPGGKKPLLEKGKVVPKYQYGDGCLSDQLLGQYLSHVVGLGYVLDPEHVKTAVKSIFDNNFRNPIGGFSNVQRVYALNDEAGLLLCSWPKGNRPALPFVYSDEVWTGIEYQVAATLIYNGWIDEGLTIVKAVRDRYNGFHRNPWDEEECGHHYARAMASWAVLLALSGYHYDGVSGELGFAPVIDKEDFHCFWSTGSGWGSFKQKITKNKSVAVIEVKYGNLILDSFALGQIEGSFRRAKVTVNGQKVKTKIEQQDVGIIFRFAKRVFLGTGSILRIEF